MSWLEPDYGPKHKEAIERFLHISDKSGRKVPFELNNAQQRVLARLSGRDIVPKARQQGITSLFLACFFLDCLAYENLRCVVIAHDADSTERLFQRVHFYLDNFIGEPIEIISSTKREIRFVATGATFYVETAGNTKSGRSGTINRLLCSEVAYWPDPKTMTAGLLQSVPAENSLVVFESTGNGAQTWYHRRCLTALNPRSEYTLHFLNWKDFPEYTKELNTQQTEDVYKALDFEYDEPETLAQHNLSAGQLAWRRGKIDEMDGDLRLFKQEYPLTLDECFQSRGQSFFHRVPFVDIGTRWKTHNDSHYLSYDIQHPVPGNHYVLGVDISGGVGGDYSVVEVLCLETNSQVAEYVDNFTSPDAFASIITWIAKLFNNAHINLETNNHGGVTATELIKAYPRDLLFNKSGLTGNVYNIGTQTTRTTKLILMGNLRKSLSEGLTIVSTYLQGELNSFIEKPVSDLSSRLEATPGAHDDSVIALGMANECLIAVQEYLAYQGKLEPKVINPTAEFTMKAILKDHYQDQYPATSGLIGYA